MSVAVWRHLCSVALGGPSAKVGSSAKFCVLEFMASLLWYGGSIGQSRFICQVFCTGIQGISALVQVGSIGQSRFICQVLCTGMEGICALVLGGPLAKVGSSAKFCALAFKASLLWYGGSIGQSRFICQVLCTGIQVIPALLPGDPLAKVGSSAKFCVLVFKASLLWYRWGPLAKVGSSAKFCVLVFKASLLWYWGVHWPK